MTPKTKEQSNAYWINECFIHGKTEMSVVWFMFILGFILGVLIW